MADETKADIAKENKMENGINQIATKEQADAWLAVAAALDQTGRPLTTFLGNGKENAVLHIKEMDRRIQELEAREKETLTLFSEIADLLGIVGYRQKPDYGIAFLYTVIAKLTEMSKDKTSSDIPPDDVECSCYEIVHGAHQQGCAFYKEKKDLKDIGYTHALRLARKQRQSGHSWTSYTFDAVCNGLIIADEKLKAVAPLIDAVEQIQKHGHQSTYSVSCPDGWVMVSQKEYNRLLATTSPVYDTSRSEALKLAHSAVLMDPERIHLSVFELQHRLISVSRSLIDQEEDLRIVKDQNRVNGSAYKSTSHALQIAEEKIADLNLCLTKALAERDEALKSWRRVRDTNELVVKQRDEAEFTRNEARKAMRWNIKGDESLLEICFNTHPASESCEFISFVPKSKLDMSEMDNAELYQTLDKIRISIIGHVAYLEDIGKGPIAKIWEAKADMILDVLKVEHPGERFLKELAETKQESKTYRWEKRQ